MGDLFDFESPPPLYAVMGNPIGHSKSPAIHRLFADACGVYLDYRAIQVDPGGFSQAVRNFEAAGGQGINVTVPFKVEACEMADQRSERAALAGAANTLKFDAHGIFADNTDGVGLLADLTVNLACPLAARQILVVGAGGAVRGVLGPLLEANPERLVIVNRTLDKAAALAERFAERGTITTIGFDGLSGEAFDVVINATSASLSGHVPPLDPGIFAADALAYDMAYGDAPTPFMRWAQQRGAQRAVDGLGMLVEQAAESFLLWHGVRPPTAEVISALRAPISAT